VAVGGAAAMSSSSSRTNSLLNLSGLGAVDTSVGRTRGNQPIRGEATARPVISGGGGDLVGFPFYGPWGSWYPWYTGGFGWGAGFYGYSPWFYAGTCWGWGHYGAWYDPYAYCFAPYWSDPGYYGYGGYGDVQASAAKPKETTGTLRLRVNRVDARVYIDTALVGTVDEFNGLSGHLEIDGGHHELKLVADGYQTYTGEINVEIGRTQTVRVTLKKK
jgi:hypothetical protein